MTYRKLLLVLLSIITLVAGWICWFSFGTVTTVEFNSDSFTVGGASYRGTLDLDIFTLGTGGPELHVTHMPVSELRPWATYRPEKYSPMGELRAGMAPTDENTPTGMRHLYLQVPVWLLWAAVSGGLAIVFRYLEKRSATGKEKLLAAREAATSVSERID